MIEMPQPWPVGQPCRIPQPIRPQASGRSLPVPRPGMSRVALLSLGMVAASCFSRPLLAQETVANQPGDELFRTGRLVQLHLTLAEEQFAALKPTNRGRFGGMGFGGRGGPERPPNREEPPAEPRDTHRNTFGTEFPWSEGKLEVDGETFQKVGVRWKGNYTYMVAGQALKRPLKIDINRRKQKQRLDGLTMLNLHTNATDPSRAREAFAFGVFRDAGVPAPRTVFAELRWTVPGQYDRELAGLYTLTEQVNARFLKRQFGDGSGLLLKPENLQGGPSYFGDTWSDYAALYHPQNEGTADEKLRLMEFCWLVSVGTDEEFAKEIGGFLEVDPFLKFIALNALLSNMDSYLGFGHNYYLYLVPGKNRFVFIPWDLDLSLATWPAVGTPEVAQLFFGRHELPRRGLQLADGKIGQHLERQRFQTTLAGGLGPCLSPRFIREIQIFQLLEGSGLADRSGQIRSQLALRFDETQNGLNPFLQLPLGLDLRQDGADLLFIEMAGLLFAVTGNKGDGVPVVGQGGCLDDLFHPQPKFTGQSGEIDLHSQP